MRKNEKVLYLVIPCFNEEEVLPTTIQRVSEELLCMIEEGLVSCDSKIVLVDDGSRDGTWQLIETYHNNDHLFVGIHLSGNFGHQNALLAGMMYAKDHSDMVITMDADLQDDIHAIREMVQSSTEGNEIVYGVRKKRDTDSFFKRTSAQGFYKFMRLMGVDVVYNHADYRLMSKQTLEALSGYQEVNLFLRGLVPLLGGFQSSTVYYDRKERFAGESKYPLRKMLSFAWQGITSFSIRPIRFVTFLGILLFILSVLVLVYALVQFIIGNTEIGWPSIVFSIWALGGIQLFAIGIIGEYIGKTYLESKRRPRYVVQKILSGNLKSDFDKDSGLGGNCDLV